MDKGPVQTEITMKGTKGEIYQEDIKEKKRKRKTQYQGEVKQRERDR